MKKSWKKITALVLTASMSLALAACGSSNEGSSEGSNETSVTTESKDTLKVAINGDVGDMSPLTSSNNAKYLSAQIYEPLFSLGYDMEIVPVLAESWEEVDSTHYTLKIREGVTDSAGNAFTANDVIFALNVYSQDAVNASYVANVDLEKTVAVDDYNVDLYLKQPNAYTFKNLSNAYMFTQAAWEASTDAMVTTPVGTGAYVLTDYVTGSFYEIEARDDYWGTEPTIKTCRFSVIAEPSQATTALTTGEVDVVMSLQISDAEYVDSTEGLTTLAKPGITSMSMYFNMTEGSVFQSKELRQAVAYAVDNEAINTIAYGGLATPSVAPFSTAMLDYTEELENEMYTTSDMEKAKALVAESGVTGGNIRIATDGTPEQTAIAEITQSILMELGFTAEINNYDRATLWDVAADPTQWDIVISTGGSPSGYGLDQLNAFLSFLNWSKWSGEEFDRFNELYVEAITADTPEVTKEKTIEAVKLVEEVVPMYSMVQLVEMYGYDEDLNFRVWNQSSLLVKDLKFE